MANVLAASLDLPANVLRCPEWQRRQRASRPFDNGQGSAALPSGPSALFGKERSMGKPAAVLYKSVAVESRHGTERYFSIYAGKRVEYKLGKPVAGIRNGPDKNSGIFAFDKIPRAQRVKVPSRSMMQTAPRAIISLRPAPGSDATRVGGGKLHLASAVPMQRLLVEALHPPTWRI
jgi:hypothetical protein